ncbi:DUF86 domain-containing protein [Candidatus Gottesmanbacteria bacterium]|nr:DUF86 domain-containing protein [Candidatus Gottesmanbacteria bacterium]
MMKKDFLLYINDMLDAIALVEEYVSNVEEEEFSKDTEKQDSVIHRLMIIGEAATHLPDDIRGLSPDTQWKAIVAFRNVAIHEYSGVSLGTVWKIVQEELPILKTQLVILKDEITYRKNIS